MTISPLESRRERATSIKVIVRIQFIPKHSHRKMGVQYRRKE